MSYRAAHTDANGTITIIGDYWTREDAVTSCAADHTLTWGNAIGQDKFRDTRFQYDRGAFSQWDGISRIYVTAPDNTTAHYDIAELTR